MEPVHGALKASRFAREDVISSMPDNVITHILDRLPIQYAVRTSILSRNWRFKWTTLSQLVFDDIFFEYLLGPDKIINYDGRHISRLLLHFNGAITKFDLYIPSYDVLDFEDINQWVMLLSRKGIKDFTLISANETIHKLPTHLFSFLELKYLKLINCQVRPPPSFHGFPNLLNLELYYVTFESGDCMDLIRGCPLLEILRIPGSHTIGTLELDEIARLKNLKILSFSLFGLDHNAITSSSIFKLVGLLPKLQELSLSLLMCQLKAEVGGKKMFPASFSCLKTLTLCYLDFGNDIMLASTFEWIWGFSNLQTLEIFATDKNDVPPPAVCSSELHHTTMGSLQLRSVEFTYFRGSKNEICLIERLLACSPLLKKMVIQFDPNVMFGDDNGKYNIARKLLMLQRASPIAQLKLI